MKLMFPPPEHALENNHMKTQRFIYLLSGFRNYCLALFLLEIHNFVLKGELKEL